MLCVTQVILWGFYWRLLFLFPNGKYAELISHLADTLSSKVKKSAFIEIIFMTYSYVHHAINTEAFPNAAPLYDKQDMTGRGRGKYWYREALRIEGETFLREQLKKKLNGMPILYVV